MNRQFLETTLVPFVRIFLGEFQAYAKEESEKSGKSFEKSFIDYFEKNDINRVKLLGTTYDAIERIKGKQDKVFAHLENDQTTNLIIGLIKQKYKSYTSPYEFQRALFEDEDKSNKQRVRENIYLFANNFNKEANKVAGVEIKTCSTEQIKNLQKLIKKVLGEARYNQVASQVFLNDNKVHVSKDLAYEMESAYKLMIENKFAETESVDVSFDVSTLSLEAVVKIADQDLQILSSNGQEKGADLNVEVNINGKEQNEKDKTPVAKLQNLEGVELDVDITIPELNKQQEEFNNKVDQKGEKYFMNRSQNSDFQNRDNRGTESTFKHVGPTEGYEKSEVQTLKVLNLHERPRRFSLKKQKVVSKRQILPRYRKIAGGQDYSVQQVATRRFTSENAKNGRTENKADQQQKQPNAGQQQTPWFGVNEQRNKPRNKQQAVNQPGRRSKSSIWKVVAGAGSIAGAPFGVSILGYMFSDTQNSTGAAKSIAMFVDGTHHMLANLMGLFV